MHLDDEGTSVLARGPSDSLQYKSLVHHMVHLALFPDFVLLHALHRVDLSIITIHDYKN